MRFDCLSTETEKEREIDMEKEKRREKKKMSGKVSEIGTEKVSTERMSYVV